MFLNLFAINVKFYVLLKYTQYVFYQPLLFESRDTEIQKTTFTTGTFCHQEFPKTWIKFLPIDSFIIDKLSLLPRTHCVMCPHSKACQILDILDTTNFLVTTLSVAHGDNTQSRHVGIRCGWVNLHKVAR